MMAFECPAAHPDTGLPFTPWAPVIELPEGVKARLRELVRTGAWDMADCAHIALHWPEHPRHCDALIWSAEVNL